MKAEPTLSWDALRARPQPKPTRLVQYGDDPLQFAQLWLPDAVGPHPVAALIHGGCWTTSIADLSYMNYAAEDLRSRGVAVWSIEYRGVDKAGGGYPGTFLDVGASLDQLVEESRRSNLSLDHVVVAGHSAGGHLALWAAARRKLPASSPLYSPHPLAIYAVVDIAGIPNLLTDTDTGCGAAVIGELIGAPSQDRPDIYADTSPAHMLPIGVPQFVIHAADDSTVEPRLGEAYVAAAMAAGDAAIFLMPPGDHVSEVAPGFAAWEMASTLIIDLAHGNLNRFQPYS